MLRFLEKSRYRKPVYLVTGLKIARGVKLARSVKLDAVGAEVSAEVDAGVWTGVPVSGGPEVGVTRGRREGVTWEGDGPENDFVFASRVWKVKVRKNTAGNEAYGKPYKTGAMLDNDAIGNCDVSQPSLVVLQDDDDVFPEQNEFLMEELWEQDELVVCAVPL